MPSPQTRIEDQTRAMFTRVLSGWAMDLLELRRTGLIVPGARDGSGEAVMPAWPGDQSGPLTMDRCWPADARSALRWRPTRRAA